jgi:hypothetical protein
MVMLCSGWFGVGKKSLFGGGSGGDDGGQRHDPTSFSGQRTAPRRLCSILSCNFAGGWGPAGLLINASRRANLWSRTKRQYFFYLIIIASFTSITRR